MLFDGHRARLPNDFPDSSIDEAVKCCLENKLLYCLHVCNPEESCAVFLSQLAPSRRAGLLLLPFPLSKYSNQQV